MDSGGDPHPHTPGDPHSVLHPHTSAPTNPPEEQAWRPSKNAVKKRLKKLRRQAAALKLEQGPSELQKEEPCTPQVRQISTTGALTTGSHGHPETPAPAPTSPTEKQSLGLPHFKEDRRAMKKARQQELKKLRQEAAALKPEQGPSELQKEEPWTPQVRQISTPGALATGSHGHPETPAPAPTNPTEKQSMMQWLGSWPPHFNKEDTPAQAESLKPEPARLRHSFLYSDRPRRSKRSTRVEEHVGEVSSREFEALALDQSPPTPDSTHRPDGTGTRVRQSALYSSRPRQSRGRQEQKSSQNKLLVEENAGMASGSEGPTGDLPELKALALDEAPPKSELGDRSKECDTASSETESEVLVEEEPEDESDFDLEEELRKLKEYKETMFYKDCTAQSATSAASCDKNSAVKPATECSRDAEWAKRAYLLQDKSIQDCLDARRTMAESSRDEPRSEVSDEDIIQNGEKWMTEEVMVAFEQYIGRTDKLRELIYCFEKLCHQCFNVECYFKIFHHFNFTVKTKLPSSDDWESRTYFAELKEMFGEKYYFCCPLELRENGQCYACKNQGANDLRHPATGGFERGLPDAVFPYM